MTIDDVRTAIGSGNDATVDNAVAALATTPMVQVEAIELVISMLRSRSARDSFVTGWQYKLVVALEAVANSDAELEVRADAARRAVIIQRDVLNDGEGTARLLVATLRLSAENDESLHAAVELAGGPEPAQVLLEKAAKNARGNDELQGRLRRALARLYEVVLHDNERAFFESLKAARKLPADGLVVDDLYRLALETNRLDEAAAFFQSLADEGAINARTRATAFNKLGALLEQKGDSGGAFAAYVGSLHHFETKAARKKAERLKAHLELSTPLPPPLEVEPTVPPVPALEIEAALGFIADQDHTSSAVEVSTPPSLPLDDSDEDTAFNEDAVNDDAVNDANHDDGEEVEDDSVIDAVAVDDHDADDVDADDVEVDDVEVDDALLSDEELEQSVAVQRFDLTVEHDVGAMTMTMPPASATVLAIADDDDDVGDDVIRHVDDRELAGLPSFLAPPIAHTVTTALVESALFSRDAPDGGSGFFGEEVDDEDAPMPPPDPGFTILAAAVVVGGNEEPAHSFAALFRSTSTSQNAAPQPTGSALTTPHGIAPLTDVTLVADDVDVDDDAPLSELSFSEPPPPPPDEDDEVDELQLPAFTMPATGLVVVEQTTRESAVEVAQRLLADDAGAVDVDAFVDAALALQQAVPGDPRVLRLAAQALIDAAPTGQLPQSAVDLVINDAFRHGDRAVKAILEIQRAMPVADRSSSTALWIAGARAAGHDVDAINDLLESAASDDGPEGAAFRLLDAALTESGDVDRRDLLYLRTSQQAEKAGDVERQLGLLRRRILVLQDARRDGPALQAWSQLVLEHPTDKPTRTDGRRFHETVASPDERARFLARLVRKLDRVHDAGESIDVLRELLKVRLAVDDKMGAEATARDLLGRLPDDVAATAVLADLLSNDARRSDELVDILRAGADAARGRGDAPTASETLERLARAEAALGHDDDAANAWCEAVRLAPGDPALLQRATDALLQADRHDDVVDLLETLADDAAGSAAARLLVRAAAITREHLKRLGRARELLQKAVTVDDTNMAAHEALAGLLLELGDAAAALAAFERVAAATVDARTRARQHLQIGTLLEEHLHRDDDALKRFRAASEADHDLVAAWQALLRLARRLGRRDVVIEALTGLAAVAHGAARAGHLLKLGRLHLSDTGGPADVVAAAAAFENALAADCTDVDALLGLVSAKARVHAAGLDTDFVFAAPPKALLAELLAPLRQVEAAGARLPFALQRLLAFAVDAANDATSDDDAVRRFDALLEQQADDLPTLLVFSSLLTRTGDDDRRRVVLETVLRQHAAALQPAQLLESQSELAALRLGNGDAVGAKQATRKALALVAANKPLEGTLSDRAIRSFVLALDERDADPADSALLEAALRLDLQRARAPLEKARLKEQQARLAIMLRNDVVAARQLLVEALEHDPDRSSARERLLELELADEDPRDVVARSRTLLDAERDPQRRAVLHLKLFQLGRRARGGDDDVADDIRAAIDLAPTQPEVVEAAERFFSERHDTRGLDELYSAQLRSLDRHDVVGRSAVLQRLAQLRRYESLDLRGAIDACEAESALAPDAIKPREDAARLYAEVGQHKDAIVAWRAVLERAPLHGEAWRGLLEMHARAQQGDEAFAVASTMVALEVADDDIVRAVRGIRPPFPRWPIPPGDIALLKKRLGHPQERTPVRAVFEVIAPRLLVRLGRPLEDFGVRRRDALGEAKLPPSVVMGVRTASVLSGFPAAMPLYLAEPGVLDGDGPTFMALPAREPGLIVTADVVKNGMTPERAFALGRAITWLSPWALLSAALDTAEIRELLESLVAAFLSPRDVERPAVELERRGAELRHELLAGLTATDADALTHALLPALRDWVVARDRLALSDWKAGVGFTGDRLGLLLSSDLPAALKVIRHAGGTGAVTRHALRELLLFSVSGPYLQLRHELSLALPAQGLAPILDLG